MLEMHFAKTEFDNKVSFKMFEPVEEIESSGSKWAMPFSVD